MVGEKAAAHLILVPDVTAGVVLVLRGQISRGKGRGRQSSKIPDVL